MLSIIRRVRDLDPPLQINLALAIVVFLIVVT